MFSFEELTVCACKYCTIETMSVLKLDSRAAKIVMTWLWVLVCDLGSKGLLHTTALLALPRP
jgi:hypothetical protein